MNTEAMVKKLHAFERRVYLGVAGLAGAGATAMVADWQGEFQKLASVGDEFAALTGSQETTTSAYENVSSALANLQAAVVDGSSEVVKSAGIHFYEVLASNHVRMFEVLDVVKGDRPPTDDTSIRAIEILSKVFS